MKLTSEGIFCLVKVFKKTLHLQKYCNGSGTEYDYDLLDRLVEIRYYKNYGTATQALTKTVYNTYNGLGFLTETGSKNDSGEITERYVFEYDSFGRLIRSIEYSYTYSDDTVTCTMVQRTEHSYDTENRLSSQSWMIGSTNFSESYTYNEADGSLTEMTTASGNSIHYLTSFSFGVVVMLNEQIDLRRIMRKRSTMNTVILCNSDCWGWQDMQQK